MRIKIFLLFEEYLRVKSVCFVRIQWYKPHMGARTHTHAHSHRILEAEILRVPFYGILFVTTSSLLKVDLESECTILLLSPTPRLSYRCLYPTVCVKSLLFSTLWCLLTPYSSLTWEMIRPSAQFLKPWFLSSFVLSGPSIQFKSELPTNFTWVLIHTIPITLITAPKSPFSLFLFTSCSLTILSPHHNHSYFSEKSIKLCHSSAWLPQPALNGRPVNSE